MFDISCLPTHTACGRREICLLRGPGGVVAQVTQQRRRNIGHHFCITAAGCENRGGQVFAFPLQ